MTDARDTQVLYKGLSIAELHAISITPAIAATYEFNGVSITGGFNPLRTLNPAETDVSKLARFIATEIAVLHAKTKI